MKKILITGATGNVSSQVIKHLLKNNDGYEIIAAVRNIEKAKIKIESNHKLSFVHFDFENQKTFDLAFKGVEILFLLRPPHIADVNKYFLPLLQKAKESGIRNIVFLSVQGVEKSKVIPHNKIESLIKSLAFDYIFVRPSYFMQNLTTSLLNDLKTNKKIILPSADAKFNWIDIDDIGQVSAKLIIQFEKYKNDAYEITGSENINFESVANILTKSLGEKISFISKNPIYFYFYKRKEGLNHNFALVMTMLHFLPRVQQEPKISEAFFKITNKKPVLFKDFVEKNKEMFREV